MSAVAPALRVRSYPALERYGLIWLWPGEPGDADPARLFDWPYCSRPGWHTIITEEMIEAPVDLLIDNLLDLTHVQFVHAFGANLPVHQASKVETWVDEGILSFKCDLKGARYSNEAGSTEDRYLEIGGSFHAPAVAMTWGIAMDGTGNKAEGPHRHYFHTLAPEAPDRTRYFAVRSWNDCISPEDIEEAIAEDAGGLREDKEIIEACHATRRRLGASVKEHFVPADEVAVRGRRQFDAMSE